MVVYQCPVCEKNCKTIRHDTISAEIECKKHGRFTVQSRKRILRPRQNEERKYSIRDFILGRRG